LAAAILAGGLALTGGRVVRIRHRRWPSFQSSTGSPVRIFLRVLYSCTLRLVYCSRCHLFVMGSVHRGARRRGGGKNCRRRAAMEREKEIGGRRKEEM
jgi:hypothetical protein